jgi:hypothetical protein
MYPGRLRPMAVNVLNLIYIGDPVSDQGLAVGRIFGRSYERWVNSFIQQPTWITHASRSPVSRPHPHDTPRPPSQPKYPHPQTPARLAPLRLALLPLVPDVVSRAAASGANTVSDPPPWKQMSLSEQFGRAFITLRSTFGGGAAVRFWDRLGTELAGKKGGAKKKNVEAVKAAFVASWGEAAKVADTRKGKVGGVYQSGEGV